MAIVGNGEKFGIINKNGLEVIPMINKEIKDYINIYGIKVDDQKEYFYHRTGVKFDHVSFELYEKSLYIVRQNNKYVIIEKNEKFI